MRLKNYFLFIFKKRKSIKLLSKLIKILPTIIIYQIFKNSIRVGLYDVASKTYQKLKRNKLNKSLRYKFLVTRIIYFEVLIHQNLKNSKRRAAARGRACEKSARASG